ncbi:hypothetical protein [Desulfonatronospira sp.]|uniref:hypothetical protein n=1 Tax=Desulfonatronospira sp. TaxID=1962951 RepID=UPI0025C09EE4|nr:hypothetical protein [Desulfonatronospira sp.]
MSTIMPEDKKIRQAVKWVDEGIQDGKKLSRLLDEAGMRFNLGPREEEFLYNFFKKNKQGLDDNR